jgi:hypothetical protein
MLPTGQLKKEAESLSQGTKTSNGASGPTGAHFS